jgi:hypothetical protein
MFAQGADTNWGEGARISAIRVANLINTRTN